jgi:peptide/nickel transport system permease protein
MRRGHDDLRAWLQDPSPTSRRQARLGQMWLAWLRIARNRLRWRGWPFVALLVLVAASLPPGSPRMTPTSRTWQPAQPPGTPGHWLGTDDFGRDILSRIIHGARITLYIIAARGLTAPVWAC